MTRTTARNERRNAPDSVAYELVWVAARLFRRFYGDWPQRVGLCAETRYPQYVRARGGHWLDVFEAPPTMLSTLLTLDDLRERPPEPIRPRHIAIEIAPIVTTHWNSETRRLEVERRPDDVWCSWGEDIAHFSVWLTAHGHHAILWEGDEAVLPRRHRT